MLRADLHPENKKAVNFFGRLGISGRLHEGLIRIAFPVYQDEKLLAQCWPSQKHQQLAEMVRQQLRR